MEKIKHNETEKINRPTLADLLGWEENVEYKGINNTIYKVENGNLFFYSTIDAWCFFDFRYATDFIQELQQAKKVEKTLKGYHVIDRYSYDCLMEELEEQGYKWFFGKKPTDLSIWDCHQHNTVIYCNKNKELVFSTLCEFNDHTKVFCELIEYHKAEPKFYAKIKGTPIVIRNVDGLKLKLTMTKWSEWGIDDTKVDFRKVE